MEITIIIKFLASQLKLAADEGFCNIKNIKSSYLILPSKFYASYFPLFLIWIHETSILYFGIYDICLFQISLQNLFYVSWIHLFMMLISSIILFLLKFLPFLAFLINLSLFCLVELFEKQLHDDFIVIWRVLVIDTAFNIKCAIHDQTLSNHKFNLNNNLITLNFYFTLFFQVFDKVTTKDKKLSIDAQSFLQFFKKSFVYFLYPKL